MANGKKRISRRIQPTMWQALNEPVVEVSEGFARMVFAAAAVILFVSWVGPYWGYAQAVTSQQSLQAAANTRSAIVSLEPQVAGVLVSEAPLWYQVVQDAPGEVAGAFTEASYEILDVSDPVTDILEFYEPGFQAVGDAWLELMQDPV